MLNYYALHHHMKQSGVRFVVENIFDALKRYSENTKLSLIYSDKSEAYNIEYVTAINVPEVDYNNTMFSSREDLDKHAMKVKDLIKSQIDFSEKTILHCHNINLIKNSFLGRALQFLADEQKENQNFLMLMQVHDLAEENRPDRLKLMQNATGHFDAKFSNNLAYPVGNNIIYLTINTRDKELLEKIGIPKNKVFLFPNSIDHEYFTSEPQNEGLKQAIKEFADKNNYIFDESRKILLAPKKIIKRKNIIECLLILKLLNSIKDEWQLLITLDAHSEEDKKISDAVKEYIIKNKLPVVIGFGYELIGPTKERNSFRHNLVDLFSIADFIIITSMTEGFGLTYLEAWLAGKVAIGRRVDFVFKEFEKNGIDFTHFYHELLVNGKDFKDYDYKEQLELLDKVSFEDLIKQDEIKDLLEFMKKDNGMLIRRNKEAIIRNYSFESYYKRLREIINIGFEKMNDKREYKIDNDYLIKYFKKND